jgi:7,8-dihydropterin-6-yl-methyl-4-(beta-D-ribofuranosyl)aminobenzene 5'-phosphate synthase
MTERRITILHDSFGKPSVLRKEWGFAALIEFNSKHILFDTDNSARIFAENTAAMGVDLRHLDVAFISHRHGDHTSGLNHLLQVHPEIVIYAPAETYGVFGSSLPRSFHPRCHTLPAHMQYYDGKPPETIPHSSPWPDAKFVWFKQITEISPGVWLIPVVSDIPSTREMPEISLGIRTRRGLVVVAGCSHPGIENILDASRQIEERVFCIFGGLHLVLTQEQEIRRIAIALRDEWRVERIAPGHCTGESAFAALSEVFEERYVFAGPGDSIELHRA